MATEVWLMGPIEGVAPVFQPAAHSLLQARAEVVEHAAPLTSDQLWTARGTAATAGFHLLHMAGALDRLFTYARGEALTDVQKTAARAEDRAHPDMDGAVLSAHVSAAVEKALAQLRATDPATAFDERKVGRAGLPSTVIGCLFHGAEHTSRHAGQFITTAKLLE
jgi:hypothetical protein